MKIEILLKPCPWCHKTPDIYMPIPEDTWVWYVECINPNCLIKPKSMNVSIRKTSKKSFFSLHQKLDRMANSWNTGNCLPCYEIRLLDLQSLPDLNEGAEYLCKEDPWFKRIGNILH